MTGTTIGPYRVLAKLGAGGMGEVYRARDTRLDRDVAIKILPPAFASDPERLARFEREARTLASLNHPNIAQIHGLEQLEGGQALVMEFLDGEDLAARIARGPLPLNDALAMTRQIASALEAAHDKGIVHRDLKPANVMVTADGDVKVLDFGLAKAGNPGASGSDLMNSPTITSPATQLGTILGTAAYMAPEQAKGRAADKRSDVWALGCVLFEMLTGTRAFAGEDLSDTLAAILRGDPDWKALPSAVPSHVVDVIRQCLARDRKERIPDASVVRYLLESPRGKGEDPPAATRNRRVLPLALSALAGAAIAAAAGWPLLTRADVRPPAPPSRFRVETPSILSPAVTDADRVLAISPNGRYIAYIELTGSATNLAVREIGELTSHSLAGTAGARTPFFSPDSTTIGFFTGVGGLRSISVEGGSVTHIANLPVLPRGATWGDDDMIVFGSTAIQEGLMRVRPTGGEPETMVKPDTAKGEMGFSQPFALPGGRGLLFVVRTSAIGSSTEAAYIAVRDLRSGTTKRLLNGTQPVYVETGHLVYVLDGALRSARFNLDRLEVTGESMDAGVRTVVTSLAAGFALAGNGTLVYIPGGIPDDSAGRTLSWFDRTGREEPVGAPARAYFALRMSPDGTRVALDVRDQETDLWVWDVGRKSLQRLTFDPGPDIFPVWSHNSRDFFFRSARNGPHALYRQAADGTGVAERLTSGQRANTPTSVTPDGRSVVYTIITETEDIMLLPLGSTNEAPRPLVQTRFRERNGMISPNGRWLAYEADQSAVPEIYVRPFPAVETGHWQVSSAGGRKPVWSRDGKELFYVAADSTLMSAPIAPGTSFSAGQPRELFPVTPIINLTSGTFYDVTPDGRRFIMIKEPARTAVPASERPHFVVVLEWAANVLK